MSTTMHASMIRILFCSFLLIWQILYNIAPKLPASMRPDIDTKSLEAWDRGVFTFLPHQALQHLRCTFFDLFSALLYTLHPFWPIGFLLWTIFKCRKLTLPYVNCFGFLSTIAVIVELIFPTAPPWYYELYGTDIPASYNMTGNPGGLARVDKLLGVQTYAKTFARSPLVWGAFPSLHCGWPSLLAFFTTFHVFTSWKYKILPIMYVSWIGFVVVYLEHHYVADVVGGIMFAWLSYELLGPHRKYLSHARFRIRFNTSRFRRWHSR